MFLFRFGGPSKEMGLGGLTRVSLVEARRLAEWCRSKLAKGENPIEARKAAGRVPTFGECADQFVASKAAQWRNAEHARQWAMTLTRYTDTVRSMPVNMIDTAEVLRVLQPHWQRIPETASRLRGRIERVLDAAQARGYRSGENPARWRGHLDTLLPPRQKLTRGHHTAGREHRVPLSPRALAILEAMQAVRVSDYVFPGFKPGRPLGDMALHLVRERMEIPYTVHGFRSTFRDWCGEATDFPRGRRGGTGARVGR